MRPARHLSKPRTLENHRANEESFSLLEPEMNPKTKDMGAALGRSVLAAEPRFEGDPMLEVIRAAEDWHHAQLGGDPENCPHKAWEIRAFTDGVAWERARVARLAPEQPEPFQQRVQPWMMECFGPEIAADVLERSDRFIEEALELVQAGGYDKARAHALVEYVYGRPQGDINQEVGGVMVTLAALCLARGVDMHTEAETELARIWTKIEKIRAKQASKPRGSALPVPAPEQGERERFVELVNLAVSADPYTAYSYVAQNDAVERQRAEKYARMIGLTVLLAVAGEGK